MPTSNYDVLGIGGSTTLRAADGTQLISYDPGSAGSIMVNVSGKPLFVDFTAFFPDVRKSGIGRPSLKTRHNLTESYQTVVDENADLSRFGGEPKKGYEYSTSRTIQPDGYFILQWADLNDSRTMPQTRVKVVISDTLGERGPVVTGGSRDTVDGKGTEVIAITRQPTVGASFTSWAGSYTYTDPLGFGANINRLPSFITATRYRLGGSMDSVALRNDSDMEYVICFSLVINNFQGSIRYYCPNGERTEMELNGRTIGVATVAFPPGGIMAYGYDAYSDTGFPPVAVTMSVVPGKYSDVFTTGISVL
ncbi:hypothetical protein 4 [Hubei tombus-like virus 2]|uniref:hypothetical protein 4 n=1 Tax=Hubei tombus-like virus 2 TaxID=1923266 RepID=UPI00090A6459|nr:hypothetical protein 4 [Hubei tombus-like virus 2]APG76560.1 hypothetical protein 4 [Hubei tombus-like virus 2]